MDLPSSVDCPNPEYGSPLNTGVETNKYVRSLIVKNGEIRFVWHIDSMSKE